jgi:diguanylate cyclase (GGDEF)-like protein
MRWTVVTSVVVFALTGELLLSGFARNSALQQAHLCNLALLDRSHAPSEAELLEFVRRYDRLLAVGLLDDAGRPVLVFPDAPEVRLSVSEAAISDGTPRQLTARLPGGDQGAWAVKVGLTDQRPATGTATSAVFLLRRDPYRLNWMIATLVFGALVWTSVHVGLRFISRWFDRRIAEPLLHLAKPWADRNSLEEWVESVHSGAWSETARIAQNLRSLGVEVVETKERVRRLMRSSQIELKLREKNFDRRLRRVRDQALLDPLTRLRNRRYLEERLEPVFTEHQRSGEHLAVVMLDLDNFKILNDTQGHQAGDDLLRFVGELLNGAIRPEDVAVRYGGDEFVLLLPATTSSEARVVAERIIKLFAQYTATLPGPGSVTMSAGIACTSTTKCPNGTQLLRRADEVLYAAKSGGKNAVCTVG